MHLGASALHNRSITVEDHVTKWAPLRVRRAQRTRAPRAVAARVACACAALFLHALALAALLGVGARDPIERHVAPGVVAPAEGYSIEPFTLVALDEVADTETVWPEPRALATLTLRGEMKLVLRDLELAQSDLGEVEATEETARSVEPAAIEGDDRAELFARYIAQIKARVERAWEQHDSPGHVVAARCLAFVTQDTSGAVLEVELTSCNADESWRQSLVTAIRRASPLPAPPVAQVFAPRVSIEFGNSH